MLPGTIFTTTESQNQGKSGPGTRVLNIVYGVGFRKMREKLNPQYELPSRKIIMQKIVPKMLGGLKGY